MIVYDGHTRVCYDKLPGGGAGGGASRCKSRSLRKEMERKGHRKGGGVRGGVVINYCYDVTDLRIVIACVVNANVVNAGVEKVYVSLCVLLPC